MTFISYAQNFEDVMLWRALKHVENGFYIDVGAAWPDEHSVTKAFYDRGWRGINIEPNPSLHQQLQEQRTRDTNLQLALAAQEGVAEIGVVEGTGLSTLDRSIEEQHHQTGWKVECKTVKVNTLKNIWEEHVPEGQPVHFLKIDVEGFEEAVLRGADWEHHRPWVVTVEATLPMSQIESYAGWEPILLAARYQLAYVDGLNRFYVTQERAAELLQSFKYPPNFFDGFKLVGQVEAETKAQEAQDQAMQAEVKAQEAQDQAMQAEVKAQEAQDQAMQAEVKAQEAQDQAMQAEVKAQEATVASSQYLMQLQAVYGSKSWRLTAPLRWMMIQTKRLKQDGLRTRLRALVKKILRKFNQQLLVHPKLRQRLIAWSQKLGLHRQLKAIQRRVLGATHQVVIPAYSGSIPVEVGKMTPRARQIYAELKEAIARHQKGGD